MQAFSWNGPEAARSVWRVNEMNWKCSYILVRWFYFVDILTMEPFRWNEQIISHETHFELSEKSYYWEFENPTSVTYSSQKQYYHKSGSDRLNSGMISIHLRQVWAEIHFLPLLNWICAIFLTLHSSGIVRKEKKNKTKHRIIIPQYITMVYNAWLQLS